MQYSVKSLLVGVAVFAVVFWATYVAPDWFSGFFIVCGIPFAVLALPTAAMETSGAKRAFLFGSLCPTAVFAMTLLAKVWFPIGDEESLGELFFTASRLRRMATAYFVLALFFGGLFVCAQERWGDGDNQSP
ncbi:hypothetical protein OAS39_08840 [Pirellulales bacterium]|nr:hypothetical protein [Pirellulales bacterium]